MKGIQAVSPEPVDGRSADRRGSTSSPINCSPQIIRFAGYAAIFNRVDKGGDIIRPGAFGDLPKGQELPLLWQHDPAKRIGHIVYAREDRRGLRVIGQISDHSRAGRQAAQVLVGGSLKGLSFGYRVRRSKGSKPRELLDIDVAEISLVAIPMQGIAQVHLVE